MKTETNTYILLSQFTVTYTLLFPQSGGDKGHKSGHRVCADTVMFRGAVHMLRARPNAPAFYSHDFSFGTETKLQAGLLRNLFFDSGQGKEIVLFFKAPCPALRTIQPPFSKCQGILHRIYSDRNIKLTLTSM